MHEGRDVEGRFLKGNVPTHSIQKGERISRATEYKPGPRPEERSPLGTVRVRKMNTAGRVQAFIKVAQPDRWLKRCRYVWIVAHGPIPRGMIIHHQDHDPLNDDLSNLGMVTRSEHGRIHGKERGFNGDT